MVSAVMTERQLVRFAADGEAKQLVAEANAKYGEPADQLSQIADDSGKRFRIARSIGQPNSIGAEPDHVFGRGPSRHYSDFAPECGHAAQAVVLQPEVVSDDVKSRRRIGERRSRMRVQEARGSVLAGSIIGPGVRFATGYG